MDRYKLSVLILSCDKNYDLSIWINRTCDRFLNLGIECLLVTENLIDGFDKRIRTFSTGKSNFDERFVLGVQECINENILVLLDDYFVYDEHLEKKIINWLSFIENEQLSSLRISDNKKWFVARKKIKPKYFLLSNIQPYEIDFHPTIWKKSELLELIRNRKFTPWSIEPCFALFLKDKKCGFTKETLCYDELIIQGAFFKKQYKRHCVSEYKGNKKMAKGRPFRIRAIRLFIFNISPYFLIRLLRKIFKIKSVSAGAKL